jgi:diguanylate cyclase (GGDEF)-like protein/PAS domain S-box-containing protein
MDRTLTLSLARYPPILVAVTPGKLPPGIAATALQVLDDAVVVLDASGVVVFANEAVLRLTQVPAESLVGQLGFAFVNPDDLPEVQRLFQTFFTGVDVPGSVAFRIRQGDQGWAKMETTGAIFEEDGATYIVIAMRQASNRQALDARTEYEARFLRTLLRHVQVGIVACDEEGRIVAFNDQVRAHHDQPDGRLPISDWVKSVHLFESDGLTPMHPADSPFSRAFQGEPVEDMEFAALTKEGALRFRRANGHLLTDDEGRRLGAFVAIEDITDQRVAEAALRSQALFDSLTGLPNRAFLAERLLGAIVAAGENRPGPVVFFLDLDNFKVVNDSLGHSAGDHLLIEIAHRLGALFQGRATVARLGGDEFVIATAHEDVVADVGEAAQQIIEAVTRPVAINGTEVRVTASVGVARSEGPHDTAERLLRDADTAMYLAKDNGRNRWQIFDRSLREAVVRRLEAEQALRKAVDDNRLRVVFQPIVAAGDEHIVGFESLIRYEDESGILVPPERFIPVAEQTGLISRIDAFVLEESCKLATLLEETRPGLPPPFVSCNFSGGTLTREDLVALVLGTLNRHSLDASRLHLELTETTLITATKHTRNALAVLRAAGVGIGIDDFGTGYSSLTYLRDLPVSFVKIDRSFISGLLASLEDAAIVRAVVRLARALGKSVVAEGVETPEQALVLEGFGCEALQGFLFGEGVTAASATAMARSKLRPAA